MVPLEWRFWTRSRSSVAESGRTSSSSLPSSAMGDMVGGGMRRASSGVLFCDGDGVAAEFSIAEEGLRCRARPAEVRLGRGNGNESFSVVEDALRDDGPLLLLLLLSWVLSEMDARADVDCLLPLLSSASPSPARTNVSDRTEIGIIGVLGELAGPSFVGDDVDEAEEAVTAATAELAACGLPGLVAVFGLDCFLGGG
jgi:hypothetical protein